MKRLAQLFLDNRDRALTLGDQAVVSGSNFLVGVVLARCLGIAGYGGFALAWMVVLVASSLHQAFFVAPLYALLPRSLDKPQHLSALMRLQLITSAALLLLLLPGLLIAFRMTDIADPTAMAIGLAAATSAFVHQDLLRRILFASKRPRATILFDVLAYGLQVPVLLLLDAQGLLTTSTALTCIALVLAIPSLAMHLYIARDLPRSSQTLHFFRAHWMNGRALLLTAVLQWSSGNLFLIAAAALIGNSAMGALRMAQNLMGVLHVLFQALENSVPLRASEVLHRDGMPALGDYLKAAFKRSAAPALAVIAILALFPVPVMASVYGAEGLKYTWVLSAFAVLYVFIFIGTFLRFTLRTLDRNNAILVGYVATTLFSLLFAERLVSGFGLPGVMFGLFIVQLINLVIYARYVRASWS